MTIQTSTINPPTFSQMADALRVTDYSLQTVAGGFQLAADALQTGNSDEYWTAFLQLAQALSSSDAKKIPPAMQTKINDFMNQLFNTPMTIVMPQYPYNATCTTDGYTYFTWADLFHALQTGTPSNLGLTLIGPDGYNIPVYNTNQLWNYILHGFPDSRDKPKVPFPSFPDEQQKERLINILHNIYYHYDY